MERSFEAVLVEQCAPTLAGLKPASLFRCRSSCRRGGPGHHLPLDGRAVALRPRHPGAEDLPQDRGLPRLPVPAGAAARGPLGAGRPDLSGPPGLPDGPGLAVLLEQLSDRLCLEEDFPHEIGLFLGYPLEDVEGFIENRGRNYTCCGCWKAYGDPEKARIRFDAYRRCTAESRERFRRGAAITELIA